MLNTQLLRHNNLLQMSKKLILILLRKLRALFHSLKEALMFLLELIFPSLSVLEIFLKLEPLLPLDAILKILKPCSILILLRSFLSFKKIKKNQVVVGQQEKMKLLIIIVGVSFANILDLPASYNASIHIDDGEGIPLSIEELAILSGVKELKYIKSKPSSRYTRGASMGAKFRNFRSKKLEIYWDDGKDGTYSGTIPAFGRTSTLSYSGHRFFFLEEGKRVAEFEMEAGKTLYLIQPDTTVQEGSSLAQQLAQAQNEIEFYEKYKNETGLPWLSFYPRDPPWLNMWPADYIGQQHVIGTAHGYYDYVFDNSSMIPIFQPLALRLSVLSHPPNGPRVFLIENLISDFECDHMISLGQKVVRQSMVGQGGGFKSKTRTSANGWLRRNASPILDHIYKRFGDVLGIDDKLLVPKFNAEELQIVQYQTSQEYAPHHDFGDDGTPEQRFLTLLLYIDLPDEGGGTSFPKAFQNQGIQVVPKRGDAVLFYNMLPDGNADDLSLHAGMPVLRGTKWVSNLWVWDPHR
uniref:Fe2OG dioxygenase domain-containing protein n=1 Tax=Aureoumbra lagunensis TaxID=44058 RepID=A0A7S3NK16_9STRA